jgi:hypothetical protein
MKQRQGIIDTRNAITTLYFPYIYAFLTFPLPIFLPMSAQAPLLKPIGIEYKSAITLIMITYPAFSFTPKK